MPTAVQRSTLKRASLFSGSLPRYGGLFARHIPAPQAPAIDAESLRWLKHWRRVTKPAGRRQALPFRNFPPAPKRTLRPLPLALRAVREWVTERHARGDGDTVVGIYLLCALQQMHTDSVLYSRDWRLELVWTGKKGYPYFGLYWRKFLVGIVDIPVKWGEPIQSCPDLRRIHSQMAAYLVCCGFTRANTVLVEGLARTPVDASKRDIHRLFE